MCALYDLHIVNQSKEREQIKRQSNYFWIVV